MMFMAHNLWIRWKHPRDLPMPVKPIIHSYSMEKFAWIFKKEEIITDAYTHTQKKDRRSVWVSL